MCYSAQVRADYHTFVRMFGATMSIKAFSGLFHRRAQGDKVVIPKAMEAGFEHPTTPEEEQLHGLIEAYKSDRATRLEQELFAQRARLVDAERKLALKVTKTASESARIATDKIERARRHLGDLRRTDLKDSDSRIYPLSYAPVMVVRDGQKVVVPMRYQCRLPGMPPSADAEYAGTYNARRDNLEKFWRRQFGVTHGIIIVNAFYENVDRHRLEGRELKPGEKPENAVLEFNPQPKQDMLVACLWAHWRAPGEPDLLSFAAITDEPPPEIAAAGHDRCIIPIKPEHVDAWLNPDSSRLDKLYEILDDRERPYYEHRLAA